MYLTVPHDSPGSVVNWKELEEIGPTSAGRYVQHISLPEAVSVKVDGRTGKGAILRHPA
jgi:hypothetical protein